MYRCEYPRPQFVRERFQILNGSWQFAFDDEDKGKEEKWYQKGVQLNQKIEVPFPYQAPLSGIGNNEVHNIVWYKREIEINPKWQEQIILHFGAVDYICEVYFNGTLMGTHTGGTTPFSFDITNYITHQKDEICVRVIDQFDDQFIPRGKQFWKEKSEAIWYTRTTGIWQSVWLEPIHKTHLEYTYLTPNIDDGTLNVVGVLSQSAHAVEVKVLDEGRCIINEIYEINESSFEKTLNIFQNNIFNTEFHNPGKTWSPEHPYLYDIEFRVLSKDGSILDEVKSYFGMRKITQENGMIYLNNRPYYQKLVLDQGYFKEGILTSPKDEDYIRDIQLAKEMGFNGCRKHQKVEDPRFLYHADKMGFIVWGEMANAANFSRDYALAMTKEWCDVLKRDYNHPSIICWVPINESWGVPSISRKELEMNHALALYHLTKSFDNTRLVISNDGWEMTKTDICAIHNYSHGSKTDFKRHQEFEKSISSRENLLTHIPAGRDIYVKGFKNEGEPIMLTEFGGIAFNAGEELGWGYTIASNEEEFFLDFERIMKNIANSTGLVGYVYTQLTDVEQEINGLVTYNRKPKFNMKRIKEINDSVGFNIIDTKDYNKKF